MEALLRFAETCPCLNQCLQGQCCVEPVAAD
jgi:hypothetical protein